MSTRSAAQLDATQAGSSSRPSKIIYVWFVPAYIYEADQLVPRPLTEVFDFFSRAENLQKLTPPWLHFKILSVQPSPIRQGTLIRYSLRWRVFPIRWTTEIVEWEPPHRFVDLQLKGPYKLWRHEHRFIPEGKGTRIHDRIEYLLPFGGLGRIVHSLKVKHDVAQIFDYRKHAVEQHFAA
jgi:ligand-binding SRPBCC domain-containing protein